MAQLVWNQEPKRYESGVDHGVLYPSEGPGVAWNGLTTVEESFDGGESNSYYFDGVKYLEKAAPKAFKATITAFSAPNEFNSCIGELSVIPGFILTRQARPRFAFSYRTLIGDGLGYQIHLVYNALASVNKRSYDALSKSPSISSFSWSIDAVPPKIDSHRASAHYVLDSTKVNPEALQNLINFLYGSETQSPHLPSADELIDFVSSWDPRIIIPNVGTGLAQLDSGLGDLTPSRISGLYRGLSNNRLAETDVNGLYRLEQ